MSKIVSPRSAEKAASRHRASAGLYAPDGGRKYLNCAERKRALAVMEQLPAEALFALTLAWTGARVSEVLALAPRSFQIEREIVAFTTLKRRRHVVREVPIPSSLMAALEVQFELRACQQDIEAAGGRLWAWHRVTAWRLVKDIMARSQISGRPSCPRGLRHGFGVGALQATVPLNLVQRWLGHSRISTTAIYTEASGPEEREFAERFWKT